MRRADGKTAAFDPLLGRRSPSWPYGPGNVDKGFARSGGTEANA